MIHVIATIELAQGKRDDFLREFQRLVPLVRAEAGCLEYGPAVDLATNLPAQSAIRPDVVTVVEKWHDVAALDAHLAAPHMADYRLRVKDLVRGVELRILAPA
jgi:quinol monooxygenase YgiN